MMFLIFIYMVAKVNVTHVMFGYPFKLHNRVGYFYTGYIGFWVIIVIFVEILLFYSFNCYVILIKF